MRAAEQASQAEVSPGVGLALSGLVLRATVEFAAPAVLDWLRLAWFLQPAKWPPTLWPARIVQPAAAGFCKGTGRWPQDPVGVRGNPRRLPCRSRPSVAVGSCRSGGLRQAVRGLVEPGGAVFAFLRESERAGGPSKDGGRRRKLFRGDLAGPNASRSTGTPRRGVDETDGRSTRCVTFCWQGGPADGRAGKSL